MRLSKHAILVATVVSFLTYFLSLRFVVVFYLLFLALHNVE